MKGFNGPAELEHPESGLLLLLRVESSALLQEKARMKVCPSAQKYRRTLGSALERRLDSYRFRLSRTLVDCTEGGFRRAP